MRRKVVCGRKIKRGKKEGVYRKRWRETESAREGRGERES